MSKQQHTPGPWVSSYMPEEGGDYVISGGNGVSVAISIGGTKTEAHNARLIAAAPELLEALIEAEHWVSEFVSQMSAYTISDKASESADRIRAAIAKARGES